MEENHDTAAFISFVARCNDQERMFLLGWVAGVLSDKDRADLIQGLEWHREDLTIERGRVLSAAEFAHDPRD